MNADCQPPTFTTVDLDWVKLAVPIPVHTALADSLDVTAVRDHIRRAVVYEVRAHLLAERLPPAKVTESQTFAINIPASPWQHWKADHATRWWLRWLVRHRPVRNRRYELRGELTVDLTRFWTYPEARVPTDAGYGRPMRVTFADTNVEWWRDPL